MIGLPSLKLSPILGILGFGGGGLNINSTSGSRFLQLSFPSSVTERVDGSYKIVRFNSSQTFRVINYASSPTDNLVDVFVVAGGSGGGGGGNSGGGGGGGIVDFPQFNLSPLPAFVPVGLGGGGGSSNFAGLTAIRGGGGGGSGCSPGNPGGTGGGGGGGAGYRAPACGGGTGFQKTQPNPFSITGDSITYGWGYNGAGGGGGGPRKGGGGGGGAGSGGGGGGYNGGGGGGNGRNLPNPLGGPGNPFPEWSSGQYSKGGNGGGSGGPGARLGNGTSNRTPTLAGDGGGSGQGGIVFMRYRFKN